MNQLLAMAVTTGVTNRTIATWQPATPRDPRVLVPIELDVLMVRTAGGAWADCGMRVPADTGKTIDASSMLPPPFQELKTTRPAGAYLHWALPDALNAAQQTGTTLNATAIPDRWLVLRIYPSPTTPNRRTIKGWVLKSGLQTPTVTELDKFIEDNQLSDAKKPLTPLGHGDLAWQAYYDNVVNRLGFYDSLSDVSQGPVAYLVCGWYADLTLDPLGNTNIRSLAEFDSAMQGFSWEIQQQPPNNTYTESVHTATETQIANAGVGLNTQLSSVAQAMRTQAFNARVYQRVDPATTPAGPPYVTDGAWWPQNTLFHGSCLGIGWPGLGWPGNAQGLLSGESGGPPSVDKINVAVGETIVEAMTTLIANATGSSKEARILEAFQLGVLAELDQPDGQAQLESVVHTAAFGSIPGGNVTERVWQPPTGPEPVSPPSDAAIDPGRFARYQFSNQQRTPSRVRKGAVPQVKQGPVSALNFSAKSYLQEANILEGGIGQAILAVDPPATEPYVPGQWVNAQRSLPRYFHPVDPVVLVQGGLRSFTYGGNVRHTSDGSLPVRLTGMCIHEYPKWDGDILIQVYYPDDVLDRGVNNGSVPLECNELLGEAAILDPGAAAPMVASAAQNLHMTPAQVAAETQNIIVDQTSWLVTKDPRVDPGPIMARAPFTGVLPAPISIGLPTAPWSPVHLDWAIQYIPSAGGLNDWTLGETDYDEILPVLPPATIPNPIVLEGRSSLHDGAANIASKAVQTALDQISRIAGADTLPGQFTEQSSSQLTQTLIDFAKFIQIPVQNVPDADKAALEDVATALKNMDVLASSINMLTLLRNGYPGDGTSAPGAGDPPLRRFFPMRAGFFKILRLRLVDGFGQFLDLAGSSDNTTVNPAKLLRSDPINIPSRPELLALPPRFTAPARISLRYLDGAGSGNEASLATDKTPGYSPVCGYLMPNHLDAALEFFADDGSNAGVVRPADDGSILWEDAPGQPSTLGQSPSRALPNQYIASIAESLIRWGIRDSGLPHSETALQAMMRVIDSTLWTVDPFGHQGDEHLSLLVGHPVVVMRASLKVEMLEPVDISDALKIKFPVRLGALLHWEDGLLGFFVNDNYDTLYCSDAAAAGLARAIGPGTGFLQQINLVQGYFNNFNTPAANDPVTHPYVDTSGTIWIYPQPQPGQTPDGPQEINLTLLVEPMTNISATTGLLPRKQIGMRREWVTAALAKIAPTFRFGPVLVDPKHIRMPIAAELNGTWTWDHRTDVITWSNDVVTNANQDANLQPDPPVASEGWLQLNPPAPSAPQQQQQQNQGAQQ